MFFSTTDNRNLIKAVVIDGGDLSVEFMRNMQLETPHEKYARVIKILNDARINLFYKPWASGEVFLDIIRKNKELENKNKVLEKNYNELEKNYNDICKDILEIKSQLFQNSSKK